VPPIGEEGVIAQGYTEEGTARFPHAVETTTTAIIDNGVIVGGYELDSFENPGLAASDRVVP
jgi:hypothetical protein